MITTIEQTVVNEVLAGLSLPQKKLSPKYLYDERGSQLFDAITELEEYYPTRTEIKILTNSLEDIAATLGDDFALIEYGSGSSLKTEILLDRLTELKQYVPLDISGEHLYKSADRLAARYPTLNILPVVADYTRPFELPTLQGRPIVFFPGSTIGNFEPQEALPFLEQIRNLIGNAGGLLLGVDLKKDPSRLHAAYNDRLGVTAAFNLNLLKHLNKTLGGNFDLDTFHHYAFYNPYAGRIEMHLVSNQAQTVTVAGQPLTFYEGETIWTESSYKYTLDGFRRLVSQAGLTVKQVWTDEERLFSLQYIVSAS